MEFFSLKGQSEIEFSYEENKIRTAFFVTEKKSANALGRNIWGKCQLKLEGHI